jgi:hypothetical protein
MALLLHSTMQVNTKDSFYKDVYNTFCSIKTGTTDEECYLLGCGAM